jgi:ubiquinone/menaquinone biosynthesis C-methylase UbiE
MSKMNKVENVTEQYQNDDNLSIRIKLHSKHSTNKQGWYPWLFEHYEFAKGYRIMELGCGNGNQWQGRIDKLPPDCTLILSDFSEGMVKMVWEKYSCHNNILSQKIDIQDIPFPDNCFDVVIANHMLYHVPDLSKAISEVHRVLRSDGKFYAATNGNGGMRTYLHNVRKLINPNTTALSEGFSFSLQNGTELLSKYFFDVQSYNFEDSLHITETQDLVDWMKSTLTISNYSESDFDKLYDYFENIRIKQGAIDIPKESGLFVSTK